jgi:hypothetical protein
LRSTRSSKRRSPRWPSWTSRCATHHRTPHCASGRWRTSRSSLTRCARPGSPSSCARTAPRDWPRYCPRYCRRRRSGSAGGTHQRRQARTRVDRPRHRHEHRRHAPARRAEHGRAPGPGRRARAERSSWAAGDAGASRPVRRRAARGTAARRRVPRARHLAGAGTAGHRPVTGSRAVLGSRDARAGATAAACRGGGCEPPPRHVSVRPSRSRRAPASGRPDGRGRARRARR